MCNSKSNVILWAGRQAIWVPSDPTVISHISQNHQRLELQSDLTNCPLPYQYFQGNMLWHNVARMIAIFVPPVDSIMSLETPSKWNDFSWLDSVCFKVFGRAIVTSSSAKRQSDTKYLEREVLAYFCLTWPMTQINLLHNTSLQSMQMCGITHGWEHTLAGNTDQKTIVPSDNHEHKLYVLINVFRWNMVCCNLNLVGETGSEPLFLV